jgi:RES domain-containing protein
MQVYRIALAKYAGKLVASGNAARWSSNDVQVIYTASSRSLACLENVVHRSQDDLLMLEFVVLTIDCPDTIKIETVNLNILPANWAEYRQLYITQKIGDTWVKEAKTAVMKVPSAIVNEEVNYLLNPNHPDFKRIKLIKTQPFTFDGRIKQGPSK